MERMYLYMSYSRPDNYLCRDNEAHDQEDITRGRLDY